MTGIEISAPGGPEVLQAVERLTPRPGPGELLIAVAAAGVNRPDVMQRKGMYPPPPGASDLPGLEIAGTVWPLLESGTIRPVIHKACPLSGAAEAHRLMESSQHIGKKVLTVEENSSP